MENNKMFETADIDAILDEMLLYRTNTSSECDVKPKPKKVKPQIMQKHSAIDFVSQNKAVSQTEMVDISNGFTPYKQAKKNKTIKNSADNLKSKIKAKKRRKTVLMSSLAVAVMVLVLGAGFCVFRFMGEFKYARNVYVNDICIGGMSKQEAQEVLAKEEARIADSINIDVTAAEKTTTITSKDLTYKFNTEKILQQAKQYTKRNLITMNKQKYNIAIEVEDDSLKEVSEKVATDLNQKAVGARVTQFDSSKSGADRFTIEDRKSGVELNKEVFENQFESFLSNGKVSGEIEAATTKTESDCTKEYLIKNIKELSSYTTTAAAFGSENSNSNMKLAATMCNNSIINPGEVWSFNECTGDSTLESNGYKPAKVYVNGQVCMGVGGGICQTSSTIYNAGLYCGLDVCERLPHAYPSTYVPVGLDATIDYGNIDLKLQNTFDHQLFMECYMEGLNVVCKFYGLENSYFDEVEITSSATSSSSAVASRTFYKNGERVTGDNIPDEELPSSSYISIDGASSVASSTQSQVQPDDTATETIPEYQPETEAETESEIETEPESDVDSSTDSDVLYT